MVSASFLPRLLYPWAKTPRYPFNRSLAGSQRRSGRFGEEKNLLLPSGIEHDSSVAHPVAYSLYGLRYSKMDVAKS